MGQALQNAPQEEFPAPGVVNPSKPILAGNYVINNQIHSELYYINTSDPAGPAPADPSVDPQFRNWEVGVTTWAQQNGL